MRVDEDKSSAVRCNVELRSRGVTSKFSGKDRNSIAWLIRADRNGLFPSAHLRRSNRVVSPSFVVCRNLAHFACKQLVTIFKFRNLDLQSSTSKFINSVKLFFTFQTLKIGLSSRPNGWVRSEVSTRKEEMERRLGDGIASPRAYSKWAIRTTTRDRFVAATCQGQVRLRGY
jgi:hypothetical protein